MAQQVREIRECENCHAEMQPLGKLPAIGAKPLIQIFRCQACTALKRWRINMKVFGSAVIALGVLWLIDVELNHGRYADVALTAARGLMRSIGIRWGPPRLATSYFVAARACDRNP
jgi:hypothetical protein